MASKNIITADQKCQAGVEVTALSLQRQVHRFVHHTSYVTNPSPPFSRPPRRQLVLNNPICLAGYTAASWAFFRDRVRYEEATLINFFGHAYLEYQQRVGTGLPGIAGYQLPPRR